MAKTVISSSPNGHVAQFYEDDATICQSAARYLSEGLERGEGALVVAGERHRRGVAAAMRAGGLDVERELSRGTLKEMDAEEALETALRGDLRNGVLDESAFRRVVGWSIDRMAEAGDHKGLRVYGQMVDLLATAGNASAAARLEELWSELAQSRRFQLFCGYSIANFRRAGDQPDFRHICSLHTDVIPAEHDDASGEPEAQRREIASLQQLARALEAEAAERKRLEIALREEKERLSEANRRKDEFIALLSHELRNPIAPILTSLDVMDVRGDTSSRREREIIRRQARHLATLVEDLLDVSRAANGRIVLQMEPVEFSAVAGVALEMSCPLVQERGHTLEVAIPRTGLLVEADPVRLPQVLANLLMNAAQYTSAGGTISFTAARQGQTVVVTVQDNGKGIAPEALGDLFAPFTQGRRSIDRSEGGLGLGLALVRSLTQLHGGSVAVRSDGLGKGSRFIVRLPILSPSTDARKPAAGETAPASRRGAKAERGEYDTAASEKGRVLVVDDNQDGAAALTELLRRLGYDVRTAHDGPAAIGIATSFRPMAAFVDIGLPAMDGYELATRLRKLESNGSLCLVAVSGYGQAADRARGVLAGFDAHVVKPLSLGTLQALLRRAAAQHA